MKTLFRIAFVLTLSVLFFAAASAQEGQIDRQIELNATVPVKRGPINSQEIALAGRIYLPVNDRVVTVADVSFKDAVNLFIQPTDQITATGQAWVFLTGPGKNRPFVFGGLAQSFFVGAPVEGVNSTQGTGGFGIVFKRASGFTAIPIVEFNSSDIQDNRTVLGNAYSAQVLLFISVGNSFNLNVAPFIKREAYPIPVVGDPGYSTRYGVRIGFSRKF